MIVEIRFGKKKSSDFSLTIRSGEKLPIHLNCSKRPKRSTRENFTVRARAREDVRYGLCGLLSSSSLRCDCSLTQCASNNSIESLPRSDSIWLVRVELDNARISSSISASCSGGSGDTLINVIDAANLKLCLLLRFFWWPKSINEPNRSLLFGKRRHSHFRLYGQKSTLQLATQWPKSKGFEPCRLRGFK